MDQVTTTFVAMDTHKHTISVAVAEGGRRGETRFLGEIPSRPEAVARLVEKLSRKYAKLAFCYEAGPCGYGLYRQIVALGHECVVVAPSLVPTRPGDRVKTDRRDAVTQASLFRSGELTPVWVPDDAHEAMRDLCRATEVAMETLGHARRQLLSFVLRHGRVYSSGAHWTKKHCLWMANLHALRAVAAISAITLVAEIGDFRRFANPRHLMAYLGLTPNEQSCGANRPRRVTQ